MQFEEGVALGSIKMYAPSPVTQQVKPACLRNSNKTFTVHLGSN